MLFNDVVTNFWYSFIICGFEFTIENQTSSFESGKIIAPLATSDTAASTILLLAGWRMLHSRKALKLEKETTFP
jgi:hypothetical protein